MSQPSTPSSSPGAHCTRCDDVLPAGYKPGLCPVCLMDVAMQQPTQDDTLPAAAPQKPLTPEDLGPHFPQLEILECIGRGGMGVVYKVRQKALGRLVALKLLAPGQTKDAAFAERFAHEARALAALNHPNIVTVYDFGESGGFYYLLMEYVDGVNLRQAMRGSHLSPEQALAIVPPICEALQYAHEHGIVHRDIKPENLLMDKAGRVKIADFGIAKMLGQQESAADDGKTATGTRSTVIGGTPQYMAPEQGSAGSRADHRVDIYSLGVVLYELLTGELPSEKLAVSAPGAMTDARLDEVVRRALQQDPEQRYQTVKELQTHLATLTAVPVEAKVHSREKYERWFALVLRVVGWLCAAFGLLQLLTPFFYPVSRPSLPPRTFLETLSSRLPEASVSWAIAWVLIRHTRLFIRLSYRPLLIPPRHWPEVAGLFVRVAGLGTLAAGGIMVAEYADSISSYRWDYIWQGILWIILGVCAFRFEHALVPVVHAVPVWKPLPYAENSARRRLSVHALCGGLLLALLMGLVYLIIIDLSENLSRTAEWEADELARLFARVLAGSLLAGLTTLTGWTAVALVRRSAGRLRGLVLASGAAAALPLYLVFVLLCFLLYAVGENRPAGQEYLLDGSAQRTLPNRPATLLWVTMVAAGGSVWLWLAFWRRLRTQPAPLSPATAPSSSGRRMTLFLSAAGVLIFCVGMPSFFRRSSPPLTIPDEQFARHVERHIHMHLGLAGHQHGMAQGSLKLPPPGESAVIPLPDLRDMYGRPLKGSLSLLRTSTGIQIAGGWALSHLRLSLEQTPFKALRREVLLPAMPEGSDKVCVIANNASAVIGAKAPSLRGHFQRDNRIDLIVRPTADGGLKVLGAGVALVSSDFPSGRNWLDLDNEKLVEAYKQAFSASRFDDQEVTLAGGRSPSVYLFVKNRRVGLLEHLGPSKSGARDVKLRVQMLPGWGN